MDAMNGRVLVIKIAVPKFGYYALCLDTEGNFF